MVLVYCTTGLGRVYLPPACNGNSHITSVYSAEHAKILNPKVAPSPSHQMQPRPGPRRGKYLTLVTNAILFFDQRTGIVINHPLFQYTVSITGFRDLLFNFLMHNGYLCQESQSATCDRSTIYFFPDRELVKTPPVPFTCAMVSSYIVVYYDVLYLMQER